MSDEKLEEAAKGQTTESTHALFRAVDNVLQELKALNSRVDEIDLRLRRFTERKK